MAKKTALITGILGQDGGYLAKLLLEKDYKVYGLMKRYTNPNFSNLEYLNILNDIELVTGDITDEGSILSLVKSLKPHEFYNLAAQSFVGSSWDLSKLTTEVNSLGVLYCLNALKHFSPMTKFYQASTSEMFGNSHEEGWQTETTPFKPRSPYAIAKLYAHWMTINFRESYQMFCCSGILFNHESPIRGKEFVTRKITDGVAKIKAGLANELTLGNLDSSRDWGFAGDYVEAMYLMLQQETPQDFVISTGKTYKIKDVLDVSFKTAGIDNWENYVKIDPRFKRPAELFTLKGDNAKAKEILGWEPKTDFENLIKLMTIEDLKRYNVK